MHQHASGIPQELFHPRKDAKDWIMRCCTWAMARWKWLAAIFGVMLLFILAMLASFAWRQHAQSRAATALYQAQLVPEANGERLAALQSVAGQWSNTPSGALALWQVARMLHASGDSKAALEQLQALIKKNPPRMLLVAALMEQGNIAREQQDYATAVDIFLRAAADPRNPLMLESRYQAALCYEEMSQFDKAAEQYRQILAVPAKSFNEDIRSRAEGRLLWLTLNAKS